MKALPEPPAVVSPLSPTSSIVVCHAAPGLAYAARLSFGLYAVFEKSYLPHRRKRASLKVSWRYSQTDATSYWQI
jgi:hypothetical protein